MPIAPTIPSLAQLRHFRRTGRFDPNVKADKFDVMKSGDAPMQIDFIGPTIACLRRDGELLGFGQVESPTPAEVAKLKAPVSKSALPAADDPNAVFDCSPLMPGSAPGVLAFVQSIGVEVQKSADTEPDIMEGIFPRWLRTN